MTSSLVRKRFETRINREIELVNVTVYKLFVGVVNFINTTAKYSILLLYGHINYHLAYLGSEDCSMKYQ